MVVVPISPELIATALRFGAETTTIPNSQDPSTTAQWPEQEFYAWMKLNS